jgi:hypothetical protein
MWSVRLSRLPQLAFFAASSFVTFFLTHNNIIINHTPGAIHPIHSLKPLSFSSEVLTESESGVSKCFESDCADSKGTAALTKLRPAPFEVTVVS